jgi:hypothetical protein
MYIASVMLRQIEILHIAEPFIRDPSPFEDEIAIAKLKVVIKSWQN